MLSRMCRQDESSTSTSTWTRTSTLEADLSAVPKALARASAEATAQRWVAVVAAAVDGSLPAQCWPPAGLGRSGAHTIDATMLAP